MVVVPYVWTLLVVYPKGPKFFNLYINDICKVSKVLKMVLFCSGDDLQNLLEDMTNEISKVKFWLDKNKLSLNLNKSKLMLFGNSSLNTNAEIQIIDWC